MMRGKKLRRRMAAFALCAAAFLGGCAHTVATDGSVWGEPADTEESGSETVRIPALETEIETVYADRMANPALAEFLAEYYAISEEDCAATRYYYNRIDLNGDGTEEIFAVTVGDDTERDGGDPALILTEGDEGYGVVTAFDYVRTPVYISDTRTNGWHDLIFPAYGGDEGTGYRTFSFSGEGGYLEAEFAEDLPEDFSGKRILSDNFIDDMDKGTYLTLAP